ncbi:RNA recognition motif. (a.k.a. RRM, RBD, or RNP domain) [Pedobacter steynii]|uniref:RNA recognition motif. (A.k.a. RRM, RBD, or RNP domain) n=1 Tax=Pedobacter steynii TaxID=430522 RepID=A0A1G9NEY4_9SPHI|nr:RNA-binding protein [Pedobacter steynii]NQX39320.1 RNA-binding protein [Pedobacter steynii]SDL85062.1 RNA recognition motif. (a.k.a. RRM, RBD, or RNP domain) [Pedobacter steynii]
MITKLFIVGYPLDIKEIELIEIFFVQGIVHSIHLVTDKITGKHKGYGFIEMADKAAADRAVTALNKTTIRGCRIAVKLLDHHQKKKTSPVRKKHFQS